MFGKKEHDKENNAGQPEPQEQSIEAVSPQQPVIARPEYDALNDKYMRLYADFDNARKLWEKQKQECLQFGSFRILKEFSTILDDIEAALMTLKIDEHKEYVEGLNMVYAKIKDLLLKEGLKAIDAQGTHFDPHVHEAIMFEDRDDVDEYTVTAVVQQGYQYGDKVLRPAKVKVSRKTATQDKQEVSNG